MPGPPTCTTSRENAASTGRTASRTADDPPTISVNVPFSAPTEPPDTGASRNAAPVAATDECSDRATSGSMVEQSTTVWPDPSAGSIADTTDDTSGDDGTHRSEEHTSELQSRQYLV